MDRLSKMKVTCSKMSKDEQIVVDEEKAVCQLTESCGSALSDITVLKPVPRILKTQKGLSRPSWLYVLALPLHLTTLMENWSGST